MLHGVWVRPRSVSSNFARAHSAEIAALASQGMLTTHLTGDLYGRLWRCTSKGLAQINE